MCKEDKMICSNEGKTYPTICSLNEEAIERGEREPGFNSPKLFMEYWGPCKEGEYNYVKFKNRQFAFMMARTNFATFNILSYIYSSGHHISSQE